MKKLPPNLKSVKLLVRRDDDSVSKKNSREAGSTEGPSKVTDKTVKQHRREIIGHARKYIYPLAPTKRRIVITSISLLVSAVVIFLIVCGLLLYKFQSTSTFIYRVTQIVPFPVAKAGSDYVSYENYLFEVRHYVHYYAYRSQQPIDFSTKSGQNQLDHYKHQALEQVVNLAYTKQLARKYNITVTRQDVNDTLAVAKDRLGRNSQEFGAVLNSFWGWSVSDYRRELKQELLMEKVASALDKGPHERAKAVLAKLQSGKSFSALAKKYSDDKSSSENGGKYQGLVSRNDTSLPPKVVKEAFGLKKGQVSGVINTGYSLEIIKMLDKKHGGLELAHINFKLAPINKFIKPLKAKNPPTYYISLPKSS